MHDEDDEIARNLAERLGPPLQRAAEQLTEILREMAEIDSDTNNNPTSEGR